jgi:hypothetical protein
VSNHDPHDTAAQARTQHDRETREKLESENELADLKWFMSSKRGRRMAWRQIERAGVFRLSFNTNSMTMAFNDGAKNEGLRVLAQIHTACPELYVTMLKEANG